MDKEFYLYFYALIPPEDIQTYVTKVKLDFKENFESAHSLKSPPHITLIPPFRYKAASESELIETLNDFVSDEITFKQKLQNFGFFPPRVVFIKVEKSENMKNLFLRFKKHMDSKLNISSLTRGTIRFSPHMTVAHRDLTKENFNRAKPLYEHKKISFEFEVNDINLLKHDGMQWEIIHTGTFNG